MSKPYKKAYQVNVDESSVVIFAHHNVVARRIGAQRLDTEFEYVESCIRTPHFDKYHWTEKVSTQALLDAGWWFECSYGYGRVTEEDDYYIDDNDNIFINFDAYVARQKAHIEELNRKVNIVKEVKNIWPLAQEIYCDGCWKGEDDKGNRRYCASFKFSGNDKCGTANFVTGEDTVMVCKKDVDEWTRFATENKKAKAA